MAVAGPRQADVSPTGTWVVEPNVLGGWDVRADGSGTRHSRHPSRTEAVSAAQELGQTVVVKGTRGEVLERIGNGPPAPAAPPAAHPAARSQPAARPNTPGNRRPGMRLAQMLTLTDQTDSSGRLLLEDSAPKPAIRKAEKAGISMATEPAPYADTPSRAGGQMNAAAYDALRRDTAAILNGFAWLAANLPPQPGAPGRLYWTSYLGVNLVHVLFHRGDDPVPPHGALPPYIASIFKASRGLFSFSVALENDKGADAQMTAAEVVAYAEEKRQLIRPDTGRVCAAPTRLIERTIDVILTGHGGDPDRSELARMVDFAALHEFTALQDRYGEALSMFRVIVDNLTAAGVTNDPARLVRTVIPGGPAKGKTFGQVTEEVVRLANDTQRAMNRTLGRSEVATKLSLPDVLRML